nr:bacteriocin fulvocin C-related protein [Saprospiraceae bacterium]
GNDSLFNYISNIVDSVEQRIYFSGLNVTEKRNVWISKFNDLKTSSLLDTNQISYLDYLISVHSIDLYDTASTYHQNFYANFNSFWENGLNYFNEIELYLIFMELSNHLIYQLWSDPESTVGAIFGGGGGTSIKTCDCSGGSRYTCGRITSVYMAGIEIEYGDCNSVTCADSKYGCGFGWGWGCTGVCSF